MISNLKSLAIFYYKSGVEEDTNVIIFKMKRDIFISPYPKKNETKMANII